MRKIVLILACFFVFSGPSHGQEPLTTSISYPSIRTLEITEVTSTGAVISGEVADNGGSPLTAKGFTWCKDVIPMIEKGDQKTVESTDMGWFMVRISGLTPETTYMIRAYASNLSGKTAYGKAITITTPKPLALATTPITFASPDSIFSGGEIFSNGGLEIISKGVCWSTAPAPDTGNPNACSHITDSQKTGSFTSEITGLAPATTYYIRAYATNRETTTYGLEKIFTTPGKPLVHTVSVNDISISTAKIVGKVTGDSGNSVVTRGICWSTWENPELGDGSVCTTENTGTETFESFIAGLTPGTTHYARTYATNSVGISYGEKLIFKTLVSPGDVNHDGTVDLADALLVLKRMVNSDTGNALIHADADVDGDNAIGMKEALFILRKAMNNIKIKGHVTASGIRVPSARVKVSSGMYDTYTDSKGYFTLYTDETVFTETAGGNILPLEVVAEGYATGYAKVSAYPGKSDYNVEIRLIPISDEITLDDNLNEGVSIEEDGKTVGELRIPNSALPAGVHQITGTVTYIDPTTTKIDAFPGGDFLAVSAGDNEEPVMLESFGVMDFNLNDQNGNPVTELNGNADICMKVPEGLQTDPGETIPLWWFNPKDGMWHEEGYGTVETRDDSLWMCGKVNHFTPWNYDRPIQYYSCFKFNIVNESDGNPVTDLEWSAESLTYAGGPARCACSCDDNDPAPCPDEKISSFTVKRSTVPGKPEKIRVYTIVNGVRYYLKEKGNGIFGLTTSSKQAMILDTPDVSGSCFSNQNVENCQFLDREDGIIPLEKIILTPEILSLTVADQADSGKAAITIDTGQKVSLKSRMISNGLSHSVEWSGTCGDIISQNPAENESVSSDMGEMVTAMAEIRALRKTGDCQITISVKDSLENTCEASVRVHIRDTYPPVALQVKMVGDKIHANFNEPVAPSSINDETFVLSNGAKGQFAYYDRTVIFTPETPLDIQTSYTVTLKSGIKDMQGNAMLTDYVWEYAPYSPTNPLGIEIGQITAMVAGNHPGVVYVLDKNKSALYYVDPIAQHIFRKVDLPCDYPIKMDYSEPDNKLYIVSFKSPNITVYDIESSTISEIPFISAEPFPYRFDIEVAPALRRIYVLYNYEWPGSQTNGYYLSIVHMDTGEILLEGFELPTTYSLTIDETRQLMFTAARSIRRFSISGDYPELEKKTDMYTYGGGGTAGDEEPYDKILLSPDGSRVIYYRDTKLFACDTTDLNVVGEWGDYDFYYADWPYYVRTSPDGSLLYGVWQSNGPVEELLFVIDAENYQTIRMYNLEHTQTMGIVFTTNSDGSVLVLYKVVTYDKGVSYIHTLDYLTDIRP